MARFDESIAVNVNVSEAYNLFSQFERFPGFMEGVEEVRRTAPDKLLWRAEIGGREEEWEAKITKEEPDTAIAWQSVAGSRNAGEVTFDKVDQDTTQVNLHIEYEPEGFVENVGVLLGVVNGRMKANLKRFKELVESGQHETGWHDPSERPHAEAERDRAVGEAKRSMHRDDVGYDGHDTHDTQRGDKGARSPDRASEYPTGSAHDSDRSVAGAAGAIGAAGAASAASTAGRTVDSAGNVSDARTQGAGMQSTSAQGAGGAIDRNVDRAGNAIDRNVDRAGKVIDRNVDRVDDAGDMSSDGMERGTSAANRTTDRVADMANSGAETARNWIDSGADAATDVGNRSAEKARDWADRGADGARDLADRARDRLDRGRSDLADAADDLDRDDDADPLAKRDKRDA